MSRSSRRRVLATALATVSLVTAGCGSGRSILQAGNDPAPATAAPQPTAPGGTTPGGTAAPGDTTVPGGPATTTPPPTTAPRPLDSLPPCPAAALDAADGPVDILFWHGMANELGRELERLAAAYNAGQDRVRVRLEFQGGYEQTIDKYLQSNQGNRPHLVQMPEYTVQQMVDIATSIPVQACVEASGFDVGTLLPAAVRAYSTEGVQWAMPFNLSNPVLYYNKQMFRAAGLDPEQPPRTLAELDAAGRAIQDSGAAAYGVALESSPDAGGGWFLEQWLAKQGAFYSDNDNGRAAPSTRVLFDQPAAVQLATELQDVAMRGSGIYVGENPGGQDQFLKMADASQPAAMTIATSAALGPVLQFVAGGIIPGLGTDDLGVGPMPSPDGSPGTLVGGAALWITSGRGDAEAAAAWDFVQYLLSAEVQSQWAAATGYVPVHTGAVELDPIRTLYTTDPRFAVAYEQVLETPDAPSALGPVLGPLREVRVTAAQAMGRIMGGDDPATALADAAAVANALIAEYNAGR